LRWGAGRKLDLSDFRPATFLDWAGISYAKHVPNVRRVRLVHVSELCISPGQRPSPNHRIYATVGAMLDIRAVIFDLDGVLADSEGIHILAWEEIAREYRLPEDRLPLHDWIGYPDTEIVKDVVREHRLSVTPEHLLEHKRRIFRRLIAEKLKAVPGSVEALSELKPLPLGLATSSSRSEAELMLRILGIERRFRAVVTSDEVKHSKPEPDSYLLAAERLGVLPRYCVAIEDSSSGVQSALQAGMTVLAVTNSLPAERLTAAHQIFSSTAEAVGWIKKRVNLTAL